MDKPTSDLGFEAMSLMFKVRDFFRPRKDVLEEVGIEPGFSVLDYGCGPGSYISRLAELVGESGKIYALDIHPRALKKVQKIASKKGLSNITTIQSDCDTGLPGDSMDVVLLYDTFHDLSEPDDVLRELHRILKPSGTLSFSDHHLKQVEVSAKVAKGHLFKLTKIGSKTYTFSKQSQPSS
jgi:ubiquinone/menaquinone biosynthesis C-methylase UbiE